MKRLFFINLIWLAGAALLSGQAVEIEFTEYKLDNGLHVILHQDN